ncbi:hypothetical protein [Bacillus sp. FJAT-26390]|uniref:hypothetical protein n=1 Tax=Bacillus sp. FJAT-26390 TaxID=1743142 RepID=UPI0020FFFA44|nr:hypothetical protein [Bacillus sp. FJAT-26390]
MRLPILFLFAELLPIGKKLALGAEVNESATKQAAPRHLKRIYFADSEGLEYGLNSEIKLHKGDFISLSLKGRLESGEEVDLGGMTKTFLAATADISVDSSGVLSANQVGASLLYAEVRAGDASLKTNDLWVSVSDPSEFEAEEYVFSNVSVAHPTMEAKIGRPALIEPGDFYPEVTLHSNMNGRVSGELITHGSTIVERIPSASLIKGDTIKLSLPGRASEQGEYELRLTIERAGAGLVYDSYYFTVWKQEDISKDDCQIAFLDKKNKMIYASDYKGNRLLDFSNAGYMGGGVPLPDVPVQAVVEPGEGDDTASIQAAIDRVEQLPVNERGFRGAVLLKRGKFEVSGTLYIRAGGIVLRGEGDGEGGTVIHGTGVMKRNLVEIGGTNAPVIDTASRVAVADLYVPSGARSFRVTDASTFRAGDQIIIRRMGNDRWIHEIGMDHIYNRPSGGVTQWSPFDLDFDRIITAIHGNEITVDAPISNAIERRWGGGEIFKYTDADRIEQVGVEHIRVDSDFDPRIIDTVMDNDTAEPYYADENHAERFVVFGSAKNGWVRNVTGSHLSYSLVQVGRHAKWITVQDSSMYDMVSIVTGGRRYAIHFMGQLSLAQRIYTETARHALIVDSYVTGPNVFLDSVSAKEYNTSEPHHRWSVGGLFDSVSGLISIRDRVWLGSGHGWAGANYVTWNTEGELTSQQPPTAQNYAIGHVGPKIPGIVPSAYDPRPRAEAYWEHEGKHVRIESLYKQQLEERLGKQALKNIQKR